MSGFNQTVGRIAVVLGIAALPTVAAASPCDDPQAAWLLCEDFEGGGSGWDAWFDQSLWTECDGCPDGTNDPARIRLVQDAALAHDGEWTVHMPGEESAGYRGGTLRFATCSAQQQSGCALDGHDRLYFRTWVRLAADHDYVHHFLGIGGSRPDAYWEANGNAGCRPNGERWAGTRVDLNSDHELFFYTYYPGMNCDAGGYCSGSYAQDICDGCATKDMACTDGLECCWGNHFSPETPVVVPTEEWSCIEMMMELNTVGAEDGSMAFWVDDELAHEVTGMHWRDVPELQLNRAMLEHYIASGDTDHSNRAWFDDVVVSTERIGCSGEGGGDDGSETGSGADDGPMTTSTSGGGGSSGGGASTNASGGDGPGDDSAGTSGDASSGSGTDAPADDGAAGCGCRAGRATGVMASAWMLLALVAIRRRRSDVGVA